MAFEGAFKEEFDNLLADKCRLFKLDVSQRKSWSERDKSVYKNLYSDAYCTIKAKIQRKTSDFWLNKLGSGLKTKLEEYGLDVHGRDVSLNRDIIMQLIKNYYEDVLFPKLEKEMNLTGFKVKNNISPYSYNHLDFSKVRLLHETTEDINN